MKRRHFLKYLSGLGLGAFFPQILEAKLDPKYIRRITGIDKPKLYGRDHRLIKRASAAFENMRADARKDGINIFSLSSYRSFSHQEKIWNRKYNGLEKVGLDGYAVIEQIIQYHAIPGTSRHHWGTDLDIIDNMIPFDGEKLSAANYQKGGIFADLKAWLIQHSESYGFYEVYNNDKKRNGFQYEPWHYSFKEEALQFLPQLLELDLKKFMKSKKVMGLEDPERGFIQNYKKNYLLGINTALIPEN